MSLSEYNNRFNTLTDEVQYRCSLKLDLTLKTYYNLHWFTDSHPLDYKNRRRVFFNTIPIHNCPFLNCDYATIDVKPCNYLAANAPDRHTYEPRWCYNQFSQDRKRTLTKRVYCRPFLTRWTTKKGEKNIMISQSFSLWDVTKSQWGYPFIWCSHQGTSNSNQILAQHAIRSQLPRASECADHCRPWHPIRHTVTTQKMCTEQNRNRWVTKKALFQQSLFCSNLTHQTVSS